MINTTDMVEMLSTLAIILGAIAGIMTSSIVIAKRLPVIVDAARNSVFYRGLVKAVVYLLYFLTLAIPNGLLIWFMIFQVGKNPRQILVPSVFFLVILQITLLVSAYSFVWGVWFAPLLRRSSEKQENSKG